MINLKKQKSIKPDVIITWPSGFDYPLCRWQLQQFRNYFDKVIIATYTYGSPDFRGFLKKAMKKTDFVDNGQDSATWRERCIASGLEISKSEWVLFTEQDFFWKGDHFLEKVFQATELHNVIGIVQGTRLHPGFLLVKRDLLEETKKEFGVKGNDKDHFWGISQELVSKGNFIDINSLGLYEGVDWFHFSSMTWNHFRIKDGDLTEFHEPTEYLVYNSMSRTKRVIQDARWLAFTHYAEMILTKFGRFLNQ